MNYRLLTATFIATSLIAGCSLFNKAMSKSDNRLQSDKTKMASNSDKNNAGAGLQKVAFVTGVSSVTVEKLAAKNQCLSKNGAGQITPKNPIEMYRIECDDGRVLMARCELRQCQLIRPK